MSDNLRDRVKQLLRDHQLRVDLESSQLMGYMLRMEPLDHLDHLADLIVRALEPADPWEERANDEKLDWVEDK